MKILVFTTLFPNSKMPNQCVFVKDRIVNLAKLCDVRVVAPVPHFPPLKINKKWFAFSRIPLEEELDGLKVYHPRYFITPKIFRSLYGFFMFLDTIGFVKRLRKDFDFDLIDAHFVYPDGLAAVLLGKASGRKVIVTARGTDINWYPKFKFIRKLIRYCLKNADAIISVNEDLKDKMIALGTEADNIEVVHSGVDQNRFFPIPISEARERLGIDKNKKILLSAGRLIEGKGFQFLIKAMSLIEDDGLELFIIGSGDYKKQLAELISKLNLKNRVKLLGEMPHAELSKWYKAADLFCLTSLHEGRPNVILESLACGTPVLTMNKWGMSDLVKDGSGVLIDSYDHSVIAEGIRSAIDRRWDRDAIARSMKGRGWDETSERSINLFDKTLKKRDIVFFSSDDWNSGLKTSKYHLATRLARDNRVFFINSLSLRTPSASYRDMKRILAKLSGFFKGVVMVRKNLFVYTPIAIPMQGVGFVRFLNNSVVTLQIRVIMALFGVRKPSIWTFLPNALGVVRRLPRRELVYYCVDDMSAFKGVPSEIIGGLDKAMTKEANVVFAVSKELYKKKRILNKNTFYSPHGVDFELFNKAVTEKDVAIPVDISDIPKPIVGFYGLISSDWIDYDLVRYISEKRPDCSFVFVGKVDTLKEALPKADNIYYLPVKPYEELYKYSRFFDVAILPFNINKLTIHSHPLKILEYLASGKPVVSIEIPEVMQYESVIDIAQDRDDFLRRISERLKNNTEEMVEKRTRFASSNSWEKRFYEIQNTISCHS